MEISEDKKLGEILLDQNIVDEEQLEEALERQEKSEQKLGEILVERGLLREKELVDFISKQTGYPVVNLDSYPIQEEAINTLSEKQARRYRVLPLLIEENTLILTMADPLDLIAVDDIEQLTGYDVEPVISRLSQIDEYVDMCYSGERDRGGDKEVRVKSSGPTQGEDLQASLQRKKQKPAVRMTNQLITDALERNATYLHLNPRENSSRILFREDGVSRRYTDLPARLHAPVVSRFKLMAEKSSEAASRETKYKIIRLDYADENVIFRLRSTETRFGEKLTVKVCRENNYERTLTDLGINMKGLSNLERFLSAPRGLVLFTGPSGHGKTTSLYSSLRFFADTPNTVITVENPVEYDLDSCTQLEVSDDSPQTQAELIYEAVEADPDILAISEIGEPRVARAALYAAATGRKVLSTYYADNAVDAVYHLANTNGVDKFQLANSLVGVVAQRLVRIIKEKYKVEYEPTQREIERLNLPDGGTCYQPDPPTDERRGYEGQTGIFQLLPVSDDLRFCILNDESYPAYQEAASELGVSSLREKGVQKILSGSTSVEEVLRATFREDFVKSLSLASE